MDVNILTDIRQALAASLVILGSLALLYLAPGLPIAWMKKALWLSVVIAVWAVLVQPYIDNLKIFAIIVLSVFVYPMLTESTVIFLEQAIMFLVTFKLFMWVFEIHAPHERPRGDQPGVMSSSSRHRS